MFTSMIFYNAKVMLFFEKENKPLQKILAPYD